MSDNICNFSELFELSNGLNADRSSFGGGIPFANTSEVIGNQSITAASMPGRIRITESVFARYSLRFGDVLFNRTSETADEIGLSCVYLDHSPAVFGGFIFRARPKSNLLDPYYAQYALRGFEVRNQMKSLGQGGIRSNIGQKDLRNITLSLPSIPQQSRIAEALSEADGLVVTVERLIAKKQAIKQGMMQQLLTGKTRLPGFDDDEWASERLGDIAAMRSGGTPDSKNPLYFGGGIPWVSISDMSSGGRYLASTEKTLSQRGLDVSAAAVYPPDAVLYAMYASIGECSLAVGRVASSQAILGITPGSRLSREFLYYLLTFMRPLVREMGQQGTQSNLNAGMVRNFDIALPSLAEQEAIVGVLGDIDAEIEALDTQLVSVRAIKQGMMQELLTGRTRLVPAEVAA